jgi:hypothetical protein
MEAEQKLTYHPLCYNIWKGAYLWAFAILAPDVLRKKNLDPTLS